MSSDCELPGSCPASYLSRSALGLARIYNLLPKMIVEQASTVKSFQGLLQNCAKDLAATGHPRWDVLYSPRVEGNHPLAEVS